MIIRLSTIQISDHWEAIKDMVDKAIPDIPGQLANTNNNLLRSLTIGESVCWVGYEKTTENQNNVICMLITKILFDETTGIRSLLIYCIAGWEIMTLGFYEEGLNTLKKYGKESSCNRIIFYSNEPRIIQVSNSCGFDTSMVFGTLQL